MCDRRCGRRRVCAERRASGRRTVADTIGGAARRHVYGRQAAPADQRASAEAGTRGPRQSSARPPNEPAAVAAPAAPAAVQPPPDLGIGNNAGPTVPPLQQTPSLGKTGTKLEDLPTSVQIINRDVINQQGGATVLDAITNASGIVQGAEDTHYDFFPIRGLNAQFYNDGSRDGDQLVGLSHSLNGVKQAEILEGRVRRCSAAVRRAARSTSSITRHRRIFTTAPAYRQARSGPSTALATSPAPRAFRA